MPHPDGTPTSDDHAAEAVTLFGPVTRYEGDSLDVPSQAVVNALRGIGHALLAIHAEMQTRRAEGTGW